MTHRSVISRPYRSLAAALLAFFCLAANPAAHADTEHILWDFDTPANPGFAPPGWRNDSQAGSPPCFQVEEFHDTVALRIRAAANTWNRVKVRTNDTFTTGVYTWRVYVPMPDEEGASTGIGAFLYSPQSTSDLDAREADFEIGWGTASAREQYNIPDGRLMCYMTVQRDDSSNTQHSSVVFQPADPEDHIKPDSWYILSLELREDTDGRYVVSWYIEREDRPRLQGRPDYKPNFGPSDLNFTEFTVHCSVENFPALWIGDNQPTTDQVAWFDWVSWEEVENGPVDPPETPELPTVTIMAPPDFTAGAFPPDPSSNTFPDPILPGEWTRFGAAYTGISILQNAAEARKGNHHLRVDANWGDGSRVGVRYVPHGLPSDWSPYERVAYEIRSLRAGTDSTHQFALFMADGGIWISDDLPVSNIWQGVELDLREDLVNVGGGGPAPQLASVIMLGWNFDNEDAFGAESFHADHVRLMPTGEIEVQGDGLAVH